MKFEVGKKYRNNEWEGSKYFTVLYIGNEYLFVKWDDGFETTYRIRASAQVIEEYKETKKVLMAPALLRFRGGLRLGTELFLTAYDAEMGFINDPIFTFEKWPSHPDDLKEYEVPVE